MTHPNPARVISSLCIAWRWAFPPVMTMFDALRLRCILEERAYITTIGGPNHGARRTLTLQDEPRLQRKWLEIEEHRRLRSIGLRTCIAQLTAGGKDGVGQ